MITKREAIKYLLEELESTPILIVGLGDDLPTIHNFYPKKYYESIKHLGFGFFEGETEHGKFSFDGGGAMQELKLFETETNSWGGTFDCMVSFTSGQRLCSCRSWIRH